jgi:hypothetical protein
MGYASYTVSRNGEQIEAGYAVEDVCNADGCKEEIDRGLDYLCGRTPGGDEYGCGGYFCGEHLSLSATDDVPQMCSPCSASWEKQRLEEFADRLAELIGKADGVKSTGVLEGTSQVTVELADGFELDVLLKR